MADAGLDIPDGFALTYRDGGEFFYLPTCPQPAKKWRGPFPNEMTMQRAMRDELGEDIADTRTIVRPSFFDPENSRSARMRAGASR
jgi:hypothetical protein